jgi:hypothetical protein
VAGPRLGHAGGRGVPLLVDLDRGWAQGSIQSCCGLIGRVGTLNRYRPLERMRPR